MIKEYRKVSTIKAEQFDGSNELINKYDIKICEGVSIKVKGHIYAINTLEGTLAFIVGDWIATGSDGEHWAIKDSIFRKTYEEVGTKEIFQFTKEMRRNMLIQLLDKRNPGISNSDLATDILDTLDIFA